MVRNIWYRKLSRAEIELLRQIDRTEIIHRIYYDREGKLILEDEYWDVPAWNSESKQERIGQLQDLFDAGATVFGALDGEDLAGMAVLEHQPVQTGTNRLNFTGLWVSHPYRREGIGKALFLLAAKEARVRGAEALYVSATPSENTVRFYLGLGCVRADPLDPTLFEKEPEDIHLEFSLTG